MNKINTNIFSRTNRILRDLEKLDQSYITSLRLRNKGYINPSLVRFTQDSINSIFKNKTPIIKLTEQLMVGSITGNDVDEILIFEYEGKIYSFNNRRLFAFKSANSPIKYRYATMNEIMLELEEKGKFTTQNDGLMVSIRR